MVNNARVVRSYFLGGVALVEYPSAHVINHPIFNHIPAIRSRKDFTIKIWHLLVFNPMIDLGWSCLLGHCRDRLNQPTWPTKEQRPMVCHKRKRLKGSKGSLKWSCFIAADVEAFDRSVFSLDTSQKMTHPKQESLNGTHFGGGGIKQCIRMVKFWDFLDTSALFGLVI